MGIKKFILAGIFLLQSTCANKPLNYEESLNKGQCENAVEQLAERNKNVHLVGQTKQVLSTSVSYAATGLAYVGDVVLTVVGGTVILAALCGPMIAASLTASNSGQSALTCLPADLNDLNYPQLGSKTFKATKSWRCPDLSSVSRDIRKVSNCYADRKDLLSLQKAKSTLESVFNSSSFRDCISFDELQRFEEQMRSIHQRIENATAYLIKSAPRFMHIF